MMKTILVVCAFLVGANSLSQQQFDMIMTKVNVIGASCLEKEHASDDDMTELMNFHIPPSSHAGRCILACFYEHFKMMKPDGTLDKQAAIDAFKELKTMDAVLHGKVLQIIDNCDAKKQILDDRCETASLLATCVLTEAQSMGITKEAFLVSE